MAFSKQDIKTINSKKTAIKDKIYKTVEGEQYIGLSNGALLLLTKYETTLRTDVDSNDSDISSLDTRVSSLEEDIELKEYTTTVDSKLSALECKLIAMNIVLG